MKKNKLPFFLIILILVNNSFARERKKDSFEDSSVFNASIFYPLSTNNSKDHFTNLNFSIFYGHVGRVEGFDLAIFASVIKNDMKGVQLTGIAGVTGDSLTGLQGSGIANIAGDSITGGQIAGIGNVAGEEVTGIQLAGIFNVLGGELKGIQWSGIFNIVGNGIKGIQSAGIFNVTGDNLKGLQAAGIFNVLGDTLKGLQAAGIFNVIGDNLKGLQVSGIFNVVGDKNAGAQFSTVNFARNLHGLQFGLVNLAVKAKGIQIGLVNYTKKEMRGLPIGVVNIARNGRINIVTWGSNVTGINTGVKFRINNIYSILYWGMFNLDKKIYHSLAVGFQYGVEIPFDRIYLNIDIGFMNIDNERLFKSQEKEKDQQVVKFRASLGFNLSRRVSLFVGTGVSYMYDHYEDFVDGKFSPLFFAGLELF